MIAYSYRHSNFEINKRKTISIFHQVTTNSIDCVNGVENTAFFFCKLNSTNAPTSGDRLSPRLFRLPAPEPVICCRIRTHAWEKSIMTSGVQTVIKLVCDKSVQFYKSLPTYFHIFSSPSCMFFGGCVTFVSNRSFTDIYEIKYILVRFRNSQFHSW